MSEFLFYYVRPEPPTWVFLSFFAVIGIFVVFRRFWSLRNLDILLVLAFTPGFMMVYEGRKATLEKSEASVIEAGEPSTAPQAEASEANVAGWSPKRLL
jgi:hypothetical protein